MRAELERAAALLRAGELVAFPTETVYGLGADAANPAAVARIFAAKGRPADHPLIVHLPDAGHLERWARVPTVAYDLAAVFWPGPLTLILPRRPEVGDVVTGGQDSIGLRIPGHPLALALLREFAGGVAAPSANRFGRISPTRAEHVRAELGAAVALVLDGGPCQVGIESTILDLTGERPCILRPGMIAAADFEPVLGRLPDEGRHAAPRVSGTLDAHYAPRTPLAVLPAAALEAEVDAALATGHRLAVLAPYPCPSANPCLLWRQTSMLPAQFAHDLYALLRDLDRQQCSRIVLQQPPQEPAWRAINDRLRRAAAGSMLAD